VSGERSPEERPAERPAENGADRRDRQDRRDQALPRFSLRRPVTVVVLLAAFLVVGLMATRLIPLELIPQGWNAPHLSINVPWQDAPPQEVVDKIILPIEEEVSSVRGIDRVNSYARSGYGGVYLTFKQDADMDVAYREVRDRVQRARLRMPDDVERVFIRKEDPSGLPIFMVGVTLDPELTDVYNLIEYQIKRPIERIDGVASVMIEGLQEKEILIELDRQATEAAGLSIYDLGRELSGDNFTLASGHVYTGGSKLLLRSVARYGSLEELESRPVGPDLRLSDIATITYAEPERRWMVRANSRPAYALFIMKEGQANTIEVAERVRELVDRFQDDPRLASVDVKIFFDQGAAIMESLGTLLDSGKIGAFFAVGVLFFFLRRVRMTLIITLSIPLSILLALAVMYFVGETLNIFSLLGLMISVGLLVDNSVVVAENIFRLHREGVPRREACVRGAGEMVLAITMATLTTVAVFVPVSLVEGGGQFFLQRLAIPISVSLLASLAVALVVIPLAVYVTLPGRREKSGPEGSAIGRWRRAWDGLHERSNTVLRHAYEQTFGRLNRAYGRLLDACLRRRLDLVLVTLVVFVASISLFGAEKVKVVPIQEDEAMAFELDVDLPRGTTYEEVQAYFLEAETVIAGMQEELGLDGYLVVCGRWGGGEIQGWFKSPRTVDVTPREAAEKVRDALPERAGVTYYLGDENPGGDEAEDKTHTIVLTGEDPGLLERTAQGLEDIFRSVPGVLGTKRTEEAAPDELALVVDRDRAQRQGVSPETVAGVVGYALRGEALPRYSQDGREIPVRVRFEEEDRQSLDQLADFAVPVGDPLASGATGHEQTSVALSSLTDVELLDAPRSIFRREKRMSRTITLELEEGEEEAARERLTAMTAAIDLPEGVSFGEVTRPQSDEDLEGLKFAALLSVVFIYLLMGFLFESFVLPLSVLPTILLAPIGVAWIHFLTGKSLDMLGIVGGVLLIGVVVNNGIVLVDYINRLRQEGHGRREAILQASEHRFRPIMMTALTTICGMVPLTLGGATSIGLSYTSFGLTLIGGMTTATLLTLLVVPIFYTLIEDLRDAITRAAARGLRRRGGGGEAVAEATPEPAG
jgi:hydrophobic/amphiphilic exporter-1 (mainly G- bacteria), HAE1 family